MKFYLLQNESEPLLINIFFSPPIRAKIVQSLGDLSSIRAIQDEKKDTETKNNLERGDALQYEAHGLSERRD